MDDSNSSIVFICTLISSVFILIYYLNPKQSTCFDCKKVISHNKQNRYSLNIEGEEYVLCKRCYTKRQKQESLIAQECGCCSKALTPRMKIHEWKTRDCSIYLCNDCYKKAERKLKATF